MVNSLPLNNSVRDGYTKRHTLPPFTLPNIKSLPFAVSTLLVFQSFFHFPLVFFFSFSLLPRGVSLVSGDGVGVRESLLMRRANVTRLSDVVK
jgi:hypothetical protein